MILTLHYTPHSLDKFSLTIPHLLTNRLGRSNLSSAGYRQVWLRGDPEGPVGHVHEGVQLEDRSGWVAVGDLFPGEDQVPALYKAMVRAVDNEADTRWTKTFGDDTTSPYSTGYTVTEVRIRQ